MLRDARDKAAFRARRRTLTAINDADACNGEVSARMNAEPDGPACEKEALSMKSIMLLVHNDAGQESRLQCALECYGNRPTF